MNRRWWVLAAVGCGTFMSTLDASIMNIAVDTLVSEFDTDLATAKWVIAAYFLALTGLLLPLGRLSDILGRRLIFNFGFVVFTLGSILCALAGSLNLLIYFRIVQAVGASMLMANGPAIVTTTFPVKERGRALGILAMVAGLGLISGPGMGGYLVEDFGWKSVFLINVPLGFIGFLLVRAFVEESPRLSKRAGFDFVGSILQLVALTLFAFTFDVGRLSSGVIGASSFARFIFAGAALFVFIAFLFYEHRVRSPIFEVSLFKNRTFFFSNLAAFLIFVSYAGLSVLLPYFLQHELRFRPDEAGRLMVCIPGVALLAAFFAGYASDRRGSRELTIAGCTLMAAVLLALAGSFQSWEPTPMNFLKIGFLLGLIGLSMALFQTPNNNALMSSVQIEKLSAASAVIATTRNMGIVVGTGVATNIFSWRYNLSGSGASSLRWTLFALAAFTALAAVASFQNRKGPIEK